MPSSDLASASISSIETAITAIKNYINPNQDTISSAIEKQLTAFETVLEKILQTIDHLMTLHAPTGEPMPPLQGTPQASFTSHLPSTGAAVKPTTTRTWADITSRPPAPLTDRRRQALHRIFSSKDEESSDSNSYTFVYISLSRRLTRTQICSKLRAISIDNLRVLDIIFPAQHIIGILIHEAYFPEFRSKLLEIDTSLIPSFNLLDPEHIADPKYRDLPREDRIRIAHSLHQHRCLRTLTFIRPNLLKGIARYFVRQGWISAQLAQDTIGKRLPLASKRRPVPYPSSAPQALKPSDTNTLPPLDSLHPHTCTLQPVPEDLEMDTSPDLVSASSSPNGHRSPSPTPTPRKLRKSSRLSGSKS